MINLPTLASGTITLLGVLVTDFLAISDNVEIAFITSFFTFLATLVTVYFAYKANKRGVEIVEASREIRRQASENQALLMKRRPISTSSEAGVFVEPPQEDPNADA